MVIVRCYVLLFIYRLATNGVVTFPPAANRPIDDEKNDKEKIKWNTGKIAKS